MLARSPLAFCVAALLLSATPPALAQSNPPNPRIALVIGESTYGDKALATPVNDAALIAQTLQAAGFDVVGARDLDEKSIRTAMRDFLNKAAAIGPDMQAFVYLAGRGVQYEGDNFFVPVDAQIARDSDVPIEAVRLADFAHALASEPGRARILVLDAARQTPYPGQGQPLAGGLALVDPDPGELIAFNAAPGSIAGDEAGPYGVYAKTLAGAMREGGLPVEDALAQTRVQVNQLTGGAQLPWSASKLTEPYYVFERAADAPPPPAVAALADAAAKPIRAFPADQAYAAALQRDTLAGYQEFVAAYPNSPEARRVRAILAARREALFWRRAVAQDTPPAYWTYLRRYPRGPHVADAERRLAVLSAAAQPPGDFAPEDYADLPPPQQDEYVYADQPVYVFNGPDYGPPPPPPPPDFYPVEDDDWRSLPPPAPPVAVGVLPALAVAIPLIIGARAYHDAGRREGRAPRGAPTPAQAQNAPPPPPPLPGGVKPLAPVSPPTLTPTGKPAPGATPLQTPLAAPTPGPENALPKGPPSPGATIGSKPTPGVAPLKTPLASPTAGPEHALPKGPPSPGATIESKPTPGVAPLKTPLASPTPGPEHALPKGPPGAAGSTPKATPELKLAPKPTPTIESNPKPAPELKLAPKPAPTMESRPAPKPELKLAPKPAPTIESRPAPKPELKVEPKPAPIIEPKPAPKPELKVEPKPAPTIESRPAPKPELKLEPKPAPPPAQARPAPGKPEKPACGKPGEPACPK